MNKRKDSKLKVKSLREEMVAAESKHLVTQNQKLLLEATQVINNDDDQNIEDDLVTESVVLVYLTTRPPSQDT